MSTLDSCRLTISPEHITQYINMLMEQAVDEEDPDSETLIDLLSENSKDQTGVSLAPFYRPEGLTEQDFRDMYDMEEGRTRDRDIYSLPGAPPLMATAFKSATAGSNKDVTLNMNKVVMAIPPSVATKLWHQQFVDYIFVSLVDKITKNNDGSSNTTTQIVISSHNYSSSDTLRQLVEKRIRDMFIEKWKEAAQKKIEEVKNALQSLQAKLLAANVRVTGDKINVTGIKNIRVSDGIADAELKAKGLVNCHKAVTLTFDYEFEVKNEFLLPLQNKKKQEEELVRPKVKTTAPAGPVIIRR